MKLLRKTKLNYAVSAAGLLPTTLLSVGLAVPSSTAHATIAMPDEIVVTARRTEEVLQNVPISMTVFNQDMLTERNIAGAGDLAAYTPSLEVNNRFGTDNATFAIRGFTQELRTTASVAVYFADVVAPRGSGNIAAGDGAGPGSFFDLQNVQVLKGPQGTLFGRNTTGGAIQLVPQEPTDKFGGYLEESRGNYDMNRLQGVLNVPVSDKVRARFGFDDMKRDGYLINTTNVGPDRLADVNYLATRASLMVDVTNDVTNYTIFTHTHSDNKGSVQKVFACGPATAQNFGADCSQTLATQGDGFYNVSNNNQDDPKSELKQWQLINTTTWNVNDSLTLKNNLSYADLKQTTRGAVFGTNFQRSGSSNPFFYSTAGTYGSTPSNSQKSIVEELQASGTALGTKLTWQAGLYYETSRPDGWSGSQSPGIIACSSGTLSTDKADWNCDNVFFGVGGVGRTFYKSQFDNKAAYSQATYEMSDEWRATLGLRYTVDRTTMDTDKTAFFGGTGASFPTTITCMDTGVATTGNLGDCLEHASKKSTAPTGLIDIDYLPTPDVLVYAKYARGYRQGSLVGAAPRAAALAGGGTIDLQGYNPEKVDAYETGFKTSFRGVVTGTFNAALFYNKLKEQQLQLGLFALDSSLGSSTTAIVNAGGSTIQGLEIESALKLFEDLTFNFGYTYLETHLDSATYPELNSSQWIGAPAAIKGDHLTFSPRHTVVTGLSYRFPLPAVVGDVSAGVNYTFTSSQSACSTVGTGSPYCELPTRQLVNLNLGWKAIYGSPFDVSFFMTNALNEKYLSYVSGTYVGTGFETGVPGEPKMWGGRVKYSF